MKTVNWFGSDPRTRMVHLGSLGSFISGSGFPHEHQGVEDEEYPFLKVGSLSTAGSDGIVRDDRNTVSEEVASSLGASVIPARSILMAKIGEAMRLRRFAVNEVECCIDNNMMAIVPRTDQVNCEYLRMALTLVPIDVLVNPGPVPSLDVQGLRMFSIPLPPLETQQRIADYLDRETAEIDAAVADLDKYVELLETRRQLHIDQTFSALLENWPLAPLGLFFSILNGDRGVNYPKAEEITQAGIPFINAGDVTERRISLSQAKFVSEEKYESMGGAKLRQGDILFCLRGSLGKHGLVDFDGGSVASSLCVLRPKNANTYRSRFLNLYLDSKFIESEVRFSENGSAQPNLSADSLSRFKVPAVSTEQQENVSTSLEEMHKEIDSLIAESTRLRELLLKRRSVLITEVVTGRKQV